MKVVLGSTCKSKLLKDKIVDFLKKDGRDYIEINRNDEDFVTLTLDIARVIKENSDCLGIIIEEYGVGSFIVATKVKGIIAANVSDERTAYMTRRHNNAKILTLGSMIVGEKLAVNIIKSFLDTQYDGGRHQIRVDMLNAMC